MALTDTAVRNAKPKNKPYKVTDGQGLYLLVNPGAANCGGSNIDVTAWSES